MIWFEHSFTKVLYDSDHSGRNTYKIYMARNEYEACQFVLSNDSEMQNLSFDLSAFTNTDGDTVEAVILREYYVNVGHYLEPDKGRADYPDPVVPIPQDYTFTLEAGKNTPFLLRLRSTEDTVPGDYSAVLKLLRDGTEIASAVIEAHVWDFAYPEAKSCATAMSLSGYDINVKHGITEGDEATDMYIKYYEFLLDYGVSSYNLPYDILSDEADKYMSDPRVTSFVIPYSGNDDTLRAYYQKLKSNDEWMEKGIFYPLDEPTTEAQFDTLASIKRRLNELFPEHQLCVPFFVDPPLFLYGDAIEYMTGVINLWCPKAYCYDDVNIYGSNSEDYYKQGFAPFAKRMQDRQAAGDKVWWYVCWEPGAPYANLFVDMQGLQHRILFWQQKMMGVDGFLYWCTNYWSHVENPWSDMSTVKWIDSNVYGDGSLLYNGNEIGFDGPVASMRLEAVRDGIEDYEMLSMAQQILGEETVSKSISAIIKSMTEYTMNDSRFANARVKLGNAIEDALKK